MANRILQRALFPLGLSATIGLIVAVSTGRLQAAEVMAVGPLGCLVLLTALEIWTGRWGPSLRRLPRDLLFFAAGGGLDVLAQLGVTWLALRFGGEGFGPMAQIPLWLAVPLGVIAADGAAYAVHRASHAHPLAWRMHALHHHPTELYALMSPVNGPLLVLFFRAVPVATLVVLGFPPEVLVAYALLDTWIGLSSHTGVDTRNPWLSEVLITPEIHRLHHSSRPDQLGNYALSLTLWDRVFGTFLSPRVHVAGNPGLADPESLPSTWPALLLLRRRAVGSPVVADAS